MAGMSRDEVVEQVQYLNLDWGDEEDSVGIVDLLCKAFSPQDVFTLLFFHCAALGATPMHAVEQGRARDVIVFCRSLVAEVQAPSFRVTA